MLAVAVFIVGLFFGIAYESSHLEKINDYYSASEISLMDSVLMDQIGDLELLSCEELKKSNIDFANKIYEEAIFLEKLEDSNKLSDNLLVAHRRYDLLRTFLWVNVIKSREKCGFEYVVYLYEYQTNDLAKLATQRVWSRILYDLKQEKQDEIILIPIAVDSEIISLDVLKNNFEIKKYPAVIMNGENVIYEISSADKLTPYLK